MTLSRELLKRLNSDDYPLAKRLKLAETAFCKVDLPLIRKEDFLLEWLCKTCATNHHTWKALNNCLKFNHIKNIRTDIKECLVEMLVQTLKTDMKDMYEEVLECCSLIFVNNSIRQYFTTKPKIVGLLIKAVLNNVLKRSSYDNIMQKKINQLFEPCKLSSVENNAVITIIESLMQMYEQLITMRDDLRLIFIQDILYPMCILVDHTHRDNTNQFSIAAYKCIQQLLLGKNKSIQNKQTEESYELMFSDLFCILSENVKTLNLQSNLLTYKFIFNTIIGTYKSNTILLDTFFRNLINSSGKYKWEILDSFLKLLNDITLDFDNIIDGITLTEYFQNFISEILMDDDVSCVHYRVLTQLSYINPLLIEKNIPDIVNKILIKEQTTDHTNLLIAILYTSTKLRREQKFISQLLISLKQHVATKKTYKANTSAFFPSEFKIQLINAISNFSNSQTIATLKTLIYYLNTDCVELLQSNTSCKNILILKTTIELLITLFEGMQIFEYTKILSTHEKFINCLDEVGNALSLLINKSLCLSYNKTVIIILLSAVHSLNEIQNMFTYYISKDTVSKKLLFPILNDPWQQLIQRITNFGEDNCKTIMNKLILHRLKLSISNKPIKLHGLIGGLEYSWSIILKHDTDMFSLLYDKEISKITYLLLTDIKSNEQNFHELFNILDKEYLQENKHFVMCLLNHILVQIGQSFSLTITEYINVKLLMENGCNYKLLEVLQMLKKQISQEQWMQMANTISFETELYLEIFLHLPMIYFSPNIRTLIFLIVYFISKKYEKNDKISALCNMIFSDLLEKTGIDLFQYIEPKLLINQLPQNKIFSKACEFSFRNVRTYSTLKRLIKSCIQCKEAMCIILECMEVVKSKLDAEQKVIFKKAEKKLVKTILKLLPEHINDAFDVRCLIAVLKVTFQTRKVTDTLKRLTEATLENIFMARESLNNTNNKLLQQSVQLSIIVLQHRKMFEIQDMIINLWFIILKHPYKNLIKLLLTSTRLKEFYEFLRLLHDQTINSLSQKDEAVWTNTFVIWSNIIKIDMNVKRNKVRLNAINNLLETILTLDMPHRYWSGLLNLSYDIISTKHLLIPDITIDLIILISLKSFDEANISSCEDVLAICGALIKVKTDLITDRLPNLLLLYRRTINIVVHASRNVADKFDEHRFRCYALDIIKLTNMLVKLKKAMVRLSPYVIADLLQLIVERTIPSYVKIALHESLCQLISICDQHGLAFLSRTLPTSLQEVFKVQLNTFKKFYKYSGKI
ncbi:PREDICTED: uncharacterized protein LOC108745332 [Trachymyrmex septentrionalis]|uniref:uncharacterized protein LOC108745332 n=1 Tax=Trachymyrmex septentrionalis TaxID=34720 RepID=UPI00084F628B|nr:PREDICTED: uncharacterized protein LOC108745332 [Trachymyrmex septentrionalis]